MAEIIIVNPDSGCYFEGEELIHTDRCTCDEEGQSEEEMYG